MFDRHLIGDIALAILLAVPTAALSRPQAPAPQQSSKATELVEQAADIDQTATQRRFAIEREG